jgi:hypothetical protein
LRLIEKHISFEFVRERLKESYSETGRPSIDPELLLRILLIGYLYGITSERKLVEELRMHLAWRWFTGLGFDQEIPHHSTFSKNRHGRFQESKLFEELFEQIVVQCGSGIGAGQAFVGRWQFRRGECSEGEPLSARAVSGSGASEANRAPLPGGTGSAESRRRACASAGPGIDHGSRCTYATKGSTPARLRYYDNYLVDNHSCVIVGVQGTAARHRPFDLLVNSPTN